MRVETNGNSISIGDWNSAVIGLTVDEFSHRGVWLTVRANVTARIVEDEQGDAWVSLWIGDPTNEIGVAVVVDDRGVPTNLAEIPMHSFGGRSDDNADRQFWTQVEWNAVPQLLAFLSALPLADVIPTSGNVWFNDNGEVIRSTTLTLQGATHVEDPVD
jgi:hypothetical protein